jgi:hypothetical protein
LYSSIKTENFEQVLEDFQYPVFSFIFHSGILKIFWKELLENLSSVLMEITRPSRVQQTSPVCHNCDLDAGYADLPTFEQNADF